MRLSEVLRTLRTEGVIEKLGVARGTRYALIPGVPQEPSPSESAPISPTSLSEFDAAVLEAVRLAGDWITFPDLLKSLRCSEDGLRATLHRLVGQGKVRRSHTSHATIYKSRSLV